MSAVRRDLERAMQALDAAMRLLRDHSGRGVTAERKAGGSLVTAADREVDALLRRLLPEPGDGWLSEESSDDLRRLTCARIWVVDPLDGTRAFVAGRRDYSVSIGLVVDGAPALGVVGNPATGVVVAGGPGLGLQLDGEHGFEWPAGDARLRVLASRSEVRRGEWDGRAGGCLVQPVGSVAYKLALVAAGVADATWTWHGKHEWDVAAGSALILAAGGEVWLPAGGGIAWNRERPRFPNFAAAGPGLRGRIEPLLAG